MRTPIRAALIAGAAVVGLSVGTAGAMAATAERPGDDGPRVVQQGVGSPPAVRPVPASTPAPVPVSVPGTDGHGGQGGQGADDPTGRDTGDDHRRHGADDPAAHDSGDDHRRHDGRGADD